MTQVTTWVVSFIHEVKHLSCFSMAEYRQENGTRILKNLKQEVLTHETFVKMFDALSGRG